MYETKRKLIYRNEEKKTSYFIAGFNRRYNWDNERFYRLHGSCTNDILLSRKCYNGFFIKNFKLYKKFTLTELSIQYEVNGEIKDYTLQKLKDDLSDIGSPKYVMIYAERPPAPPKPFKKKTKKEIDDRNQILHVKKIS